MLKTEMRNAKTTHIDKMDTLSMLRAMNEENFNAVKAVDEALDSVARAVDEIANAFQKGGRLIYLGCGTSGRLCAQDAAECPPTFGVPSGQCVALIAGGERALTHASEGEEDSETKGVEDLKNISLSPSDIVVGVSAAGGAAYVVRALEYAKSLGCVTVGITSNADSPLDRTADISIVADTGAEAITGSTRLKAGTAQKIILNMLSTGAMVKSGYVYENLMVNLKPSNKKLTARMVSIVSEISSLDQKAALRALEENDWDIKKAVAKYLPPSNE